MTSEVMKEPEDQDRAFFRGVYDHKIHPKQFPHNSPQFSLANISSSSPLP